MTNHQLALVCLLSILGSTGHTEDFSAIGTEAVEADQVAPAHSVSEIQQWIAYLKITGQWPALKEEQQKLLEPSIIEKWRAAGEIEDSSGSKVSAVCTDR